MLTDTPPVTVAAATKASPPVTMAPVLIRRGLLILCSLAFAALAGEMILCHLALAAALIALWSLRPTPALGRLILVGSVLLILTGLIGVSVHLAWPSAPSVSPDLWLLPQSRPLAAPLGRYHIIGPAARTDSTPTQSWAICGNRQHGNGFDRRKRDLNVDMRSAPLRHEPWPGMISRGGFCHNNLSQHD